MKRLDRIQQLRSKHEDVQRQVIATAANSAKTIAEAVGRDLPFNVRLNNINFPSLAGHIAKGDLWLSYPDDRTVPQSQWSIDEARHFAEGVDALMDYLGDQLQGHVDEEESILHKVTPEDGEVSTLSEQDFPEVSGPAPTGPMPPALGCTGCGAFFPPQNVYSMTNGNGQLPTNCPQCKVGTLLPGVK